MAELEISNFGVEDKLHATLLQPLTQRANHRILLVINGSHNAIQLAEARDHVSEPNQISLELNGTVPGLEGKGRTSHEPEIGAEEARIKLIGGAGSPQHDLRLELQPFDRTDMSLTQAEVRSVDRFTAAEEAGLGRGLHRLVPFEYLLSYYCLSLVKRGIVENRS
jgi:hypothetical protein